MLFNRQIRELTKGKWQTAEGGAISAEFQVAGVINSALHSGPCPPSSVICHRLSPPLVSGSRWQPQVAGGGGDLLPERKHLMGQGQGHGQVSIPGGS